MEIKIGKTARTCAACDKAFQHEEDLASLVRIEEGLLVREDYCLPCWDEERAVGAFSAWTPRYYDPAVAEQAPAETFSPLRRLFQDAVEADSREQAAVAYLAAQLLRRQKVFRLIKESEGEGEHRIALYVDRIGDRLIQVRDADFSYAELEAARTALLEKLAALEAPEAPEEAESSTTDEAGQTADAAGH